MQICAAPCEFSGRINLHAIRRANHTHQLAFCHDGAASHASALGNMLDALNSFFRHLQLYRPYLLPPAMQEGRRRGNVILFFDLTIAAFMDLAADHLAEILIEHQLNAFFLFLLTLLFIIIIFFHGIRCLEDLGFHLEQFIQ